MYGSISKHLKAKHSTIILHLCGVCVYVGVILDTEK